MDYETLTSADRDRMKDLNSRNGYGIKTATLIRLIRQHRSARKRGDKHAMELIEYRLTDINFHYEVGKLANGEYDSLIAENKAWLKGEST